MIGEKPKVASRLANALGDYSVEENRGVKNYVMETENREIIIAPAVGHIFNLEQTEEGWDYPVFDVEWKPIFETQDGANYVKKYFNNLRDQLEKADSYINACDFDVEGATIGGVILKEIAEAENQEIERMKFSTLTPSDLQDAFDNLEEFDHGMTEAGITRHVLDFYYGINVSRALMKAVRSNDRYKTLSTGRVQGPTLKILAEREREIKEFEPEPYWELYLIHEEFEAQWEDEEDRIWKEEVADRIFSKIKGEERARVSNIKVNNYKHNPPIPFNLTGLQSEASSQFNLSPKATQSISQDLYEEGLISYPRTESQKLPPKIGYKNILNKLKKKKDDYKEKAEKVLEKDKNDNLYTTQGKKEDDAHPAIYPTGEGSTSSLSKREKQVYDLIVKRFFAVFGKTAKRKSLTMTLSVKEEDFKAKSKVTVERNWYDLYEPYVKVDEAELPDLEEGDVLDVEEFRKEEKETQPPNRYSQSKIVNKLEKRELGTKCLTEEEKIIVRDGDSIDRVPVSELLGNQNRNEGQIQITSSNKDLQVIGYNSNFEKSGFSAISRRKLEEDEKVVELKLRDSSTINVTSNHPVLVLEDGEAVYREAGKVDKGDRLIRSHRADVGSVNQIGFEEFIQKLDRKSSLYGDCKFRKERERLGLSQKNMADRLETPRSTLSKVENRKHGLLRYWKKANLEEPDYISSENFELKIPNPFPIKISPAFMRLVGMLEGDGSLDIEGKKKENKLDFRYHNTEKELVNQFRRDVESIFRFRPEIKCEPPSTGDLDRYYVRLPAVIGRIMSIITENLSRKWIMKQDRGSHYVGALLADEGHVSNSEPKIFISNTDKGILQNCSEILLSKGIDSKINMSQKKIYIRGRRNLEKFLEEIPIFSTRKHQALIDLLERHYKFGGEESSLMKQKKILSKVQEKPRTLKDISEGLEMSESAVKHQLYNLRDKGYVEKKIEGISERPRKIILYESTEPISETFFSELDEKAFGEAHTAEVGSVNEVKYSGYVYDILDTENNNFILDNRTVVHNSTRAQTVDRLYDRNYIENQPIEVTDLGLVIVETLEEYSPDLVSEELTREFEKKMESIRQEKESREEVLDEAQDKLIETLTGFREHQKEIGKKLVETIDQERQRRRQLGPCDQCEDGTLRMIKKGGSRFVGCSNYPDCENTYPLPNNGDIESTDEICDECNTPKIFVDRDKGKNYKMCIKVSCPTKDNW